MKSIWLGILMILFFGCHFVYLAIPGSDYDRANPWALIIANILFVGYLILVKLESKD